LMPFISRSFLEAWTTSIDMQNVHISQVQIQFMFGYVQCMSLLIENVPQYHVGTIWDDSFFILGVTCGVQMEHGNNIITLNILASPPRVVPFNNPQYCDIVALTRLGCKSMRALIWCLEILPLYNCTHL
jgi:hypothetical protein